MHPLIGLALQFCPRAFRDEYYGEIAADVRKESAVFLDAFDLLWMGVSLHVERFASDLAYAVQMLTKTPTFTIVATGAITLAIAVNVAAASTVAGILLRPLPFPNSDRLVFANEYATHPGAGAELNVQPPTYGDLQRFSAGSTTFDAIAAAGPASGVLAVGRGNVNLTGFAVTANYFDVYGLRPQLGRLLTGEDIGKPEIVISDGTWRSIFKSDPAVIGRSVMLDGHGVTIVGVLTSGFRDLSRGLLLSFDYWMPLKSSEVSSGNYLTIFGRMRAGVSMEAAQADLSRIAALIAKTVPAESDLKAVRVTAMASVLIGDRAPLLWLLYAGALVVLLIACVNVANLWVVRAAGREREIALRSALGASRTDIMGLLCTEAGVLATVSGVLGIGLGVLILHVFAELGSSFAPHWSNVVVDGRIVAYTIGLVIVTTIATGVFPLLLHGKNVSTLLGTTARTGGRRGKTLIRSSMVVVEVALAFAVVMSAGLLTRSFIALTNMDLGFTTSNVYAAMFPVSPRLLHDTQPERSALENRMLSAFDAIPGVTATAVGSGVPYLYAGDIGSVTVPGRTMKSSRVRMVSISSRYFDALGIPLLRGRMFAAGDRGRNEFALVVNQAFADRFSLGPDAISHAVNVESVPGRFRSRTIVGVVGNIRNSLAGSHVPTIYVPSDESAFPGMMVVRTAHPILDLANAITRAQSRIDPTSRGVSLFGMDAAIAHQVAAQRTIAQFFGLLASIALLLALAGTYAVTSSATQARTHEFGVRRAIGATATGLLREVIRGAGSLGAIGIVAGVVLMAMLSNQVDSILFHTSALDPLTIVSVGAGLLGATVLAALLPALRATRVDPAVSLHYE